MQRERLLHFRSSLTHPYITYSFLRPTMEHKIFPRKSLQVLSKVSQGEISWKLTGIEPALQTTVRAGSTAYVAYETLFN